jgi:hypothetical protein
MLHAGQLRASPRPRDRAQLLCPPPNLTDRLAAQFAAKINQEEAAERCGLHRTYYSVNHDFARNLSLFVFLFVDLPSGGT